MDSVIALDVEMPSESDVAGRAALKAKAIRNKILPPDESAEFGPEDIMEIPLLVRHESLNVGRRQGKNRSARSRSVEHRNEKTTFRHYKKNRCYDFYGDLGTLYMSKQKRSMEVLPSHIQGPSFASQPTKLYPILLDKGYCMRGDKCRYDHGQHPVVLNDSNSFGEHQSYGIPLFNQGRYANVPDNQNVVFSFNAVSPPDAMPKTPFNTPAIRTAAPKLCHKDQASSYHPYSKVFSKSYNKSASLSKEEKHPVKKNSLLLTMLDLHRRRTNLYKEQVDQQRVMLLKMQSVEDSETKGKYLKLIKKNNELLKSLKSEIEFLGQDIIAMRSKQEEQSKKEGSAVMEGDSSSAVHKVVKQDGFHLNPEKI